MKLVRDKIPQIIEESGKSCEYHIADDDEYKTRLYEKMCEEIAEFIETPCYEEAADIYEVFSSICAAHGMNIEGVAQRASVKKLQRGGFIDRIVLEAVNES
jgi:predicted house-cleaning noncanonical NTP pyrophosphatase (MazG superfamily)